MATAIKICRVCGKEYEACHTQRPVTVFRWQEVACSPECGSIYLAQIEESRKTVVANTTVNKTEPIELINDIEDDIDEDEFNREIDEYFDNAEEL